MNRPTIDVDELLDLADEALAAGDTQEAVGILRRATSIAPLRKDIRNRLAIVLEGTPVESRIRGKMPALKPQLPVEIENDFPLESQEIFSGREAISQIAKRAFEAASEKTNKAGVATRKLTNLLQQGLSSWKTRSEAEGALKKPLENAPQPPMFEPEMDLQEYLNKNSGGYDLELPEENMEEVSQRVIKHTSTSRKSSSTQKLKRPADVEDVLAAGIGGFIEAATRLNRRKIAFGFVYVSMVVMLGYACFDVSRKFSGVPERHTTGSKVTVASVGLTTGNIHELNDQQAFEKSRQMAAAGNFDGAINLLKQQLESGNVISNRESIRIELAKVLNDKAERLLRENNFELSVAAYRESLQFLPHDSNLQIRLSNALYYYATLGTTEKSQKADLLRAAEASLVPITEADRSNLQAFRLLAMVYEAGDKDEKSKVTWKKVKALAPADSEALAEANAHLK